MLAYNLFQTVFSAWMFLEVEIKLPVHSNLQANKLTPASSNQLQISAELYNLYIVYILF